MHRVPLGARPWLRVMLVVAQVSSINTSFSTSIAGCASLHARRAACTSSRSCSLACSVFFEGQIPLVQLVPKSTNFGRNTLQRQSLSQLLQSQPRLGCDPAPQNRFRFLQPRPAMAADLKTAPHTGLVLPVPHLINVETADLKAPRNRRWAIPAGQRAKHTITQILRIRLHPDPPFEGQDDYRTKCRYLN